MLPVRYQFQGRERTMPERFVLARDDTGSALSIVSSAYQVVQPHEVLEFYRDLVQERHHTLETAGALDGGRKIWALARTGLVANVADNAADEIGAYVLLATSCDKSLATTATFTSIRVVCQNTLGFAFDDIKQNQRKHIKADHTKKFDPAPVKEKLGLIDNAWLQFLAKINPMGKPAEWMWCRHRNSLKAYFFPTRRYKKVKNQGQRTKRSTRSRLCFIQPGDKTSRLLRGPFGVL